MAEYKNEEPCEFIYNITAIEKVVDGDTIDAVIDLGFDVRFCGRIRMLGIDTPESRTRDLEEKKYGLAAKSYVQSFLPVGSMQTLRTTKDDKGKFGRILGEFVVYDTVTDSSRTLNQIMIDEHYGVEYYGQSKEDIAEEHLRNRRLVKFDRHKNINTPIEHFSDFKFEISNFQL